MNRPGFRRGRDNSDFLFGFESYDGVAGAVDDPHQTSVDPSDTYRTLTEVTGAPSRTYLHCAHDHATDFGITHPPTRRPAAQKCPRCWA